MNEFFMTWNSIPISVHLFACFSEVKYKRNNNFLKNLGWKWKILHCHCNSAFLPFRQQNQHFDKWHFPTGSMLSNFNGKTLIKNFVSRSVDKHFKH